MTTKADFTPEEWTRILRAPYIAGMAVSLADPGGPFEMGKETMATMKSAMNPPSREQLLAEVALDVAAMAQQKKTPLSGFKPDKGALLGKQVLDELTGVSAIVGAKASPEEAAAYRQWLLVTAQAAANAAKEGGFMGFRAVQVSEGEQRMLDQLKTALSLDAGQSQP